MQDPAWDAVDDFFNRTLVAADPVFDDVLRRIAGSQSTWVSRADNSVKANGFTR